MTTYISENYMDLVMYRILMIRHLSVCNFPMLLKMVLLTWVLLIVVDSSLQSIVIATSNDTSYGKQEMQQIQKEIIGVLTKIKEPEIGVSIMELELVDKVSISNGTVFVDLHLTSPFAPAQFGFKVAQDIRDSIYTLQEVSDVKVNVTNHFMAEAINKEVNESEPDFINGCKISLLCDNR
jgi:metal-sulfur cluster biosynthetic enzyme